MSRNKQDFFHGGVGHLQPGDLVLPSAVHGGFQTTQNGTSYAWATRNPSDAAAYAQSAANRTGSPGHVYKVRPVDGDHPNPDATHHERRARAHGREAGWVVESRAWSTENQDTERHHDVLDSNLRQYDLRDKRLKLQAERAPKKPQTRVSPQTQAILDLL